MSVLRKRSTWIIPTASLILGALTLGLVGCGGNDDTPFPPKVLNGTPPPNRTADVQSAPAVTGQPTNLNVGPVQTSVTGLPAGASLGASVFPTGLTTLPSISGLSPVVEFQIGTVGEGGLLNTSCPDATVNTFQVTLTDAQLNLINTTQAQGGSIVVYQNVGGVLTLLHLNASLNGNVLTVTSDTPLSPCGDFIVTAVAAHAQGSIG